MNDIKENTGAISSGSVEIPIKFNEEDYIELTEEDYNKLIINKLMREQVYNSKAAKLTNKNLKTSKREKPLNVKVDKALPFNNDLNTPELAIERGNNSLTSMKKDIDKKDIASEYNLSDHLVKDEQLRANLNDVEPDIQLGDNIVSESSRFNYTGKEYLNKTTLNLLLEKYEHLMKGKLFTIIDKSKTPINIDWTNRNAKAIVLENCDVDKNYNNYNTLNRLLKS